VSEPLTPEEEAGIRASAELPGRSTSDFVDPWQTVDRLLATLDATRATPPSLDVECPHCVMEHQWPCPTIGRCDEPGCEREATCGWPSRPGGTGPNGGYRRTCGEHMRNAIYWMPS